MQRQPALATPVHVPEGEGGDDFEEEQKVKSSKPPKGSTSLPEAAIRGLPLAFFFLKKKILLCFQKRKEAEVFAGKVVGPKQFFRTIQVVTEQDHIVKNIISR